MLIQKQEYEADDIVTIKLMSGEEVIGKYVKSDDVSITLDRPLMLAMSQKGVGMVPVLMTVNPDSTLKFNKLTVIVQAHSDEEIGKQYVYQTTGIQPVTNSKIVL
jgi:hypothetical protein